MHMMHHHFGIRLRGEAVALGFHTHTQRVVIFNNAVMHDADFEAIALRKMRMCVGFGRNAVRRPARMCQARLCGQVFFTRQCFQMHDASGRAQSTEALPGNIGDTRRVITAILELADAADQYVNNIAG